MLPNVTCCQTCVIKIHIIERERRYGVREKRDCIEHCILYFHEIKNFSVEFSSMVHKL